MAHKDVTDLQFLRTMHQLFGTRRMVEVMGWCLLIGFNLRKGETRAELVERLMKLGVSRAAAYRAVADIKRLGNELSSLRGETVSMADVLEEIRTVDVSLMGDEVVQ